jgi:hypothetical protein
MVVALATHKQEQDSPCEVLEYATVTIGATEEEARAKMAAILATYETDPDDYCVVCHEAS